jgi:hypothetical protein
VVQAHIRAQYLYWGILYIVQNPARALKGTRMCIYAVRQLAEGRWEILAANPEAPYGPMWRRVGVVTVAGCRGRSRAQSCNLRVIFYNLFCPRPWFTAMRLPRVGFGSMLRHAVISYHGHYIDFSLFIVTKQWLIALSMIGPVWGIARG